MNKYTIEVKDINPMETAPVWDYYNGGVEVICLFYLFDENPEEVMEVFGYYDRECNVWRCHYDNTEITEEIIGWLPDYKYVG